MKRTARSLMILAAAVFFTATTACVSYYDPNDPHGTTTYLPPGGSYSSVPVVPVPVVDTEYCGTVSGYTVPGNVVTLYDAPDCDANALTSVRADSSGYFEVSLCASVSLVGTRSFDAWGQGSVCSVAPVAAQ